MSTPPQEGISLQWLTPNEMTVEPIAQREFKPALTERIVKNYDEEKIGELRASHRDGQFYVTDGQHRRAALIELGLGEVPVPVVVHEDRTIRDDAKSFVATNVENVNTSTIDAFRLKVVAEDPESVDIQSVLTDFDLTTSYSGSTNAISCIAALQWIYRRGGGGAGGRSLLVRTLTLIEATWGRDRQGREGHLVKAVALILDKVGNQLDLDSFAAKVAADSSPNRVLGTARTHVMATRRAVYVQAAEVLVNIYNKQRSTRRISLT